MGTNQTGVGFVDICSEQDGCRRARKELPRVRPTRNSAEMVLKMVHGRMWRLGLRVGINDIVRLFAEHWKSNSFQRATSKQL